MGVQKMGPSAEGQISGWKPDKGGTPASSQSGRDLHKLIEKNDEENLEAWARFPSIKIGNPEKAQKLYQLMLDTFGPPPSASAVEEFLKEHPSLSRLKPAVFEAPEGNRTPEAPSAATRRKAIALNNAFATVFEGYPKTGKGPALTGRVKKGESGPLKGSMPPVFKNASTDNLKKSDG